MAISFSPDAAEGTMRDATLTAVMLGAAGTRPALAVSRLSLAPACRRPPRGWQAGKPRLGSLAVCP